MERFKRAMRFAFTSDRSPALVMMAVVVAAVLMVAGVQQRQNLATGIGASLLATAIWTLMFWGSRLAISDKQDQSFVELRSAIDSEIPTKFRGSKEGDPDYDTALDRDILDTTRVILQGPTSGKTILQRISRLQRTGLLRPNLDIALFLPDPRYETSLRARICYEQARDTKYPAGGSDGGHTFAEKASYIRREFAKAVYGAIWISSIGRQGFTPRIMIYFLPYSPVNRSVLTDDAVFIETFDQYVPGEMRYPGAARYPKSATPYKMVDAEQRGYLAEVDQHKLPDDLVLRVPYRVDGSRVQAEAANVLERIFSGISGCAFSAKEIGDDWQRDLDDAEESLRARRMWDRSAQRTPMIDGGEVVSRVGSAPGVGE